MDHGMGMTTLDSRDHANECTRQSRANRRLPSISNCLQEAELPIASFHLRSSFLVTLFPFLLSISSIQFLGRSDKRTSHAAASSLASAAMPSRRRLSAQISNFFFRELEFVLSANKSFISPNRRPNSCPNS